MRNGGKVVVTGATSGLGRNAAHALARRGAHVVVCGRTAERAAEAADVLGQSAGAVVEAAHGDLEQQDGVAELAAQLTAGGAPIDVLLLNAGSAFAAYGETEDGFERSVAVNHVAPLLLTRLLEGVLAPGAVVLAVTSRTVGFAEIDETDPDVRGRTLANGYSQLRAYGFSKLLLLLAMRSLAVRAGTRFTPVLFDPGGIQTDFAVKAGDEAFLDMTRQNWAHMNTPEQAAADLLAALSAPSLVSGTVYSRDGIVEPPASAQRDDLCDLVYDRTTAAFLPSVVS